MGKGTQTRAGARSGASGRTHGLCGALRRGFDPDEISIETRNELLQLLIDRIAGARRLGLRHGVGIALQYDRLEATSRLSLDVVRGSDEELREVTAGRIELER